MDIINTISVIKFLISRYSETLIELFYNLSCIQSFSLGITTDPVVLQEQDSVEGIYSKQTFIKGKKNI